MSQRTRAAGCHANRRPRKESYCVSGSAHAAVPDDCIRTHTARTRWMPRLSSSRNWARTMSKTVSTGNVVPYGFPVTGLIDEGPDDPVTDAATSGMSSKRGEKTQGKGPDAGQGKRLRRLIRAGDTDEGKRLRRRVKAGDTSEGTSSRAPNARHATKMLVPALPRSFFSLALPRPLYSLAPRSRLVRTDRSSCR